MHFAGSIPARHPDCVYQIHASCTRTDEDNGPEASLLSICAADEKAPIDYRHARALAGLPDLLYQQIVSVVDAEKVVFKRSAVEPDGL